MKKFVVAAFSRHRSDSQLLCPVFFASYLTYKTTTASSVISLICLVLMFPTFLQIILDLYRILYIRVRGLRLLKFRCMRLICCFECLLIRDGQATLPCWFPRSDVQTIMHRVRCFVCFFVFLKLFLCFFALLFVYLGTIYIINK